MRVWLAVVAAGCFEPAPHLGQACTSWCPPPESCVNQRCVTRTGGGDGGVVTVDANYMFVTSTKRLPSEIGGIFGGDAWCNDLAAAAGLPGQYYAWLSDSVGMQARDRIFVKNARGWYRTDGLPIADQLSDLTGYSMFYPPRFDELGHDHGGDPDTSVGTGTYAFGDGIQLGYDCSGFTSNTGVGMITGYLDGGAYAWSEGAPYLDCSTPIRIYCMGISKTVEVKVAPPPSSRLAFIATTAINGGLAGLDSACRNAASGAGLGGTFAAWASTTTAPANSRFSGTLPWRRLDNVLAMSSTFELTAPIDMVVSGSHVSGDGWSGSTSPDAKATTANCADWSNGAMTLMAATGRVERGVVSGAFGAMSITCNQNVATYTYCLEQ